MKRITIEGKTIENLYSFLKKTDAGAGAAKPRQMKGERTMKKYEIPTRWWEPGSEDANSEQQELNELANLEIPFE